MSYLYSKGKRVFGDIEFEDDTNTQIDFEDDYIAFVAGGSTVLAASGSMVGIGTSTPDYTLDVAGNIGLNEYIYHNGDADTYIQFPGATNQIDLVANTYSFLKYDGIIKLNAAGRDRDTQVFAQDDSVVLHVDAGNAMVGIGTDAPDYTLDVAGDIGVDQYIYHNGDADTWMKFGNNAITFKAGGLSFINLDKKGSAPHELTINDGGNNIDFVVKGNGSNAGNPGMKFDASNNRVGINGVGNPSWELDVAGDIGLAEYIYHKGDDDTYIRFQDNDVRIATAGNTRLKISGSQGQVTFNEAFTFPHSDGNRDQVLATDGDGAVSWVDPGGASANSEVLMVHLSSDFAYDTSGDNEFQTVPFNSILKSTFGGSDFNTSNYTFTAPEEGFYFINLTLFQQSINTDTTQYQVRISSSADWAGSNGAIAFRNYFPGASAETTMHTHRLDRIAHLSGSDTVKITFRNIRTGTESGTYLRHEPHLSYLTIQKL